MQEDYHSRLPRIAGLPCDRYTTPLLAATSQGENVAPPIPADGLLLRVARPAASRAVPATNALRPFFNDNFPMTPDHPIPTSSRALLRAASADDLPAILRLERIPEFHTMVGVWPEQEHRRALFDPDHRYLIVLGEQGETAGFAILRGLSSPHRNLELKRFVIERPGAGLGRRALRALMDLAFGQLGAHRLWLDVFPTNARALHVYRQAGFRQEGTLREAIYRDGEFHSLLLLAILDREYLARSPTSPAP